MEEIEIINRYHSLLRYGLTQDEAALELGIDKGDLLKKDKKLKQTTSSCKTCRRVFNIPEKMFCSFTCFTASSLNTLDWETLKGKYRLDKGKE